ncbi:hypothetical protein [Deinococcus roseus]|uniref:DUF1328 domain-containing protein n=1 Tax=Deinococcus roseus TaxID=392414 RepID=A0ABQ2D158_9DEIO|nr:hypothetical protein [Deinococcus roseus]GGJ40778.1 hypothetical protein GCM10008938_28530 [Deinococcus roseus]
MSGNNTFLYILLIAFATFGIVSGYKENGAQGVITALAQYGIPVVLAMLVLQNATRMRKRRRPPPRPPVQEAEKPDDSVD